MTRSIYNFKEKLLNLSSGFFSADKVLPPYHKLIYPRLFGVKLPTAMPVISIICPFYPTFSIIIDQHDIGTSFKTIYHGQNGRPVFVFDMFVEIMDPIISDEGVIPPSSFMVELMKFVPGHPNNKAFFEFQAVSLFSGLVLGDVYL